jgi:hypothetical protein
MLGQMATDLEKAGEHLDEFQLWEEAKNELGEARDQMICPECNGAGCSKCRRRGIKPGPNLGTGPGEGERPEEKDDVDLYDTRAAVKVGRGQATLAGETDGPNIKGSVQQRLNRQLEAAKKQAGDPLTAESLPRKQREQFKEYFNQYREGR